MRGLEVYLPQNIWNTTRNVLYDKKNYAEKGILLIWELMYSVFTKEWCGFKS
jgi:hypothetical protein